MVAGNLGLIFRLNVSVKFRSGPASRHWVLDLLALEWVTFSRWRRPASINCHVERVLVPKEPRNSFVPPSEYRTVHVTLNYRGLDIMI